jgi:Large polyvalent protein associated domain 29
MQQSCIFLALTQKIMTNPPEIFSAKQTAKFIRTSLKEAFPGQKFTVTSYRYFINIDWRDGVSSQAVTEVTAPFTGMLPNEANITREFQGRRVIFANYQPTLTRNISLEFATRLIDHIRSTTSLPVPSIDINPISGFAKILIDDQSLAAADQQALRKLIELTGEKDLPRS